MAGFMATKIQTTASRRRFLVWGTMGAAAFFVPTLAGCSGGSKKEAPDSDYIGSYRAAYIIPTVSENGTFSYSVAQKGDMIGSFVDSSTNATRAFSGHVDNNGTFSGTTTDIDGTSFATSGTVSKVISSSTGGDFRQNRKGTMYSGSFSYLTTGVTAPTDSQYAGAYSGSYNLSGETAGPASYSIDKLGGVTGFVTTNGQTGTLRGQVSNTGSFTGTVAYASNDVATLNGTLAISTTAGQSAGNVVETRGGVSRPGTFGAPTPLAATTPFLVAFRGTYGISDLNDSGDVSFTVDPSGSIAGSFNQNNNSVAGVFAGSISSDGNFNGTLTYPATSGATAYTRSIQGKMVKGSSNSADKLQADFTVQDASGAVHPGSLDATLNAASNEDSIFRGSFIQSATLRFSPYQLVGAPGGIIASSSASLTVDKEGKLIGFLADGTKISGAVTNDGRLNGALALPDNVTTYLITGKVSNQQVFVDTTNYNADPIVPSSTQSAGIAINFQVTINGINYPGRLTATGGFQAGN
jgi:hypothetical protein